jgi:hypothetical protein
VARTIAITVAQTATSFEGGGAGRGESGETETDEAGID